ncbi:hypothetical protein VTI74DRAFT_9108 [Chaetomium olivicolor]
MLSHLRFHRRAPSNPASPLPDQAPTWDPAAQREHPQPPRDVSPRPGPRPRSPNTSQLPPTLPPIARVASTASDRSLTPRDTTPLAAQDARPPPARPAHGEDHKSGFIGGVALQNYRRAAQEAQVSDHPGNMSTQVPESQLSRPKPPPPPINTSLAARSAAATTKQGKSSWFSLPSDPGPGGAAGKRPTGVRLASEPNPAVAVPEHPKAKKGLPFLKNPMSSLLTRMRTAQAAAESAVSSSDYDPRIKGTRVHDFSAPRPKRTGSGAESGSKTAVTAAATTVDGSADHGTSAGPNASAPVRSTSAGTSPHPASNAPCGDVAVVAGSRLSVGLTLASGGTLQDQPVPSLRTSSSAASRDTQATPVAPAATLSIRTVASRQLSRSEASKRDSAASAVPRHMKSTSSRFSFDMVGAANQEKLLEERHRQREQERKTSDPTSGDARFDDFDEEYDYDPMMDDDGLEERIPGVNADYEEEEDFEAAMDPDNDQENFAGFTFQRSNPVSSLASPNTPAMMATPRDATGNAIGCAMTKDTTPEIAPEDSPLIPDPLAPTKSPDTSGLGIQGLGDDDGDVSVSSQSVVVDSSSAREIGNGEIYLDDGLADELDFEPDGTVFDESIFDIIDTDRYGRPIPGAFARAQEAMKAAQREQLSKRDSDMTSSLSAQSGAVHSTAHTSLSAALQQPTGNLGDEAAGSPKQLPAEPMSMMGIPGQDLAYQAALAEAAQKAAASGKFRRSSSPEEPAFTETPVDDHLDGYQDDSGFTNTLDGYEDHGGYTNDFDDFDFDDEAIIAEANASALANDSDGFYGQEFGFYSAPLPQPSYGHASTSSSSGVLTTENLFQYANGGYFGPAGGVMRSKSGRIVCREPNLTPITERSEYSNRNSVMSFSLPPSIGDGGRNSTSLTSPGLAQLALLPDDTDNMSLSALMKLRSKAWGGSQASLVSSREGSPRSERAVPFVDGGSASPYGTVPAHLAGHVRVNSGLSMWSASEAGSGRGSGAASPTVGMHPALSPLGTSGVAAGVGMGMPPRPGSAGAVGPGAGSVGMGLESPLPQRPHSLFLPQLPLAVPSPGTMHGGACSPVLESEEAEDDAHHVGRGLAPALPLTTKSPVQMQDEGSEPSTTTQQQQERGVVSRRLGMGHCRVGSADSVSYVKDEEGGGNRWLVERRRTADNGEVEVLRREVVEGGMI